MARLKNYTRSLASGYALMAVNIVYSLAMIPLALTHLDQSVFGIWAVVVQIGVFLQLTDLGMTGAFVRILIEHKDATDRKNYASVIKTMWMVFCLQGVVIGCLGWFLAPLLGKLFKIDPELQPLFTDFMRVYLAIFGLTIGVKVFELTLSAHQRNDLVNLNSMLGFAAGFAVLWLGLRSGWGLWAVVWAYGTIVLLSSFLSAWQSRRNGVLPSGLMAVRFSRERFQEVFDYGKDRFLVTAGYVALQAAPTFLVTRFLGLEAAAAWMVGTRAFYLCVQAVGRLCDFAYPAFAEMYVRNELARLKNRFISLLDITVLTAGLLGVAIALLNTDFVTVISRGVIVWDSRLDPLLGLWLITVIIRKTAWLPIGASMRLGFMRFVDVAEALVMIVGVVIILTWNDTLQGALLGVLLASFLGGAPYCIRRSGQILNVAGWGLLREPVATLLSTVVPLAIAAWVLDFLPNPGGLTGLALKGSLLGIIAAMLLVARPKYRNLIGEMVWKLDR
ncbi:MAG TPA: oligosaccharide flippase family protein [Verrucomicrobiota bacterium]|nr:oligosaccharide flippase family protein [Verrucomicrobiota bacterium]